MVRGNHSEYQCSKDPTAETDPRKKKLELARILELSRKILGVVTPGWLLSVAVLLLMLLPRTHIYHGTCGYDHHDIILGYIGYAPWRVAAISIFAIGSIASIFLSKKRKAICHWILLLSLCLTFAIALMLSPNPRHIIGGILFIIEGAYCALLMLILFVAALISPIFVTKGYRLRYSSAYFGCAFLIFVLRVLGSLYFVENYLSEE